MRTIRIGTRGSRLALAQAREFAELLHATGQSAPQELVVVQTEGDTGDLEQTGAFTSALERALLEGRVDCAVHSFKDLPLQTAPGTTIGACLPRASAADVLISRKPDALQQRELRVGTSSRRRVAELKRWCADWVFRPVRGNVDTRLRHLLESAGDCDALVLARAALDRGSFSTRGLHVTVLPPEMILPAPGQGCIAVQCMEDDIRLLGSVKNVDHHATRCCVMLEKFFLQCLEGGCDEPFGCLIQKQNEGFLIQAHWHRHDGIFLSGRWSALNFDQARNIISKQAEAWLSFPPNRSQ